VWPLINIINFKFVPAKLQVLFGNFVAIFCTRKHTPDPEATRGRTTQLMRRPSALFLISVECSRRALAWLCALGSGRDGVCDQDDGGQEVKLRMLAPFAAAGTVRCCHAAHFQQLSSSSQTRFAAAGTIDPTTFSRGSLSCILCAAPFFFVSFAIHLISFSCQLPCIASHEHMRVR
jgi:hypothetical protein